MRKTSKPYWSWSFGVIASVVVFSNGKGKAFEREGYRPNDAESFCEYLNTRG